MDVNPNNMLHIFAANVANCGKCSTNMNNRTYFVLENRCNNTTL